MIRKGQYTKNYTVLPNTLTQDRNLSFEAKGMLAYLMSKPDEWIVRETDLCKEGNCGTTKVRRILKELIAAKYIIKARHRNNDGTYLAVEFEVFPEPQLSTVQKSTVDNPAAENAPTTKERLSKNKDSIYPPNKNDFERRKSIKRTGVEDYKFCDATAEVAHNLGLSEGQYKKQKKLFRNHHLSKGTRSANWDAQWESWLLNAIERFDLKPEYAKRMEKQRKFEAVADFIIDCRGEGDEQQKIINKILGSEPHLGWRGLHNGELNNCFELADQKQGADSPPKT